MDGIRMVAAKQPLDGRGYRRSVTESQTFGDAVVVTDSGAGPYGQRITAGGHQLTADEPAAAGGADSGPSPYDLLLASLGSCTAITVRMYAERKGWPLDHVTVRLRHQRIHAKDCADCETRIGQLDHIERELQSVSRPGRGNGRINGYGREPDACRRSRDIGRARAAAARRPAP
jgi:putative redox protein